MTDQHELRLEVGTEVPWVLSGPGAGRYLLVNDYLGLRGTDRDILDGEATNAGIQSPAP